MKEDYELKDIRALINAFDEILYYGNIEVWKKFSVCYGDIEHRTFYIIGSEEKRKIETLPNYIKEILTTNIIKLKNFSVPFCIPLIHIDNINIALKVLYDFFIPQTEYKFKLTFEELNDNFQELIRRIQHNFDNEENEIFILKGDVKEIVGEDK